MSITQKSAQYRSYIPFLYFVWVDNMLSPGEWNVIKTAIAQDKRLSDEERKELTSFLDRDAVPDEKAFNAWREWIDESGEMVHPAQRFPLSQFVADISGVEDVTLHQGIEKALDLRPSAYRHVFPSADEKEYEYSTDEFQELRNFFNPNSQELVTKLHELLSQDIFNWQIVRNKEDLRDKTLKQLMILAHKGYGAMAYPEKYGGKNSLNDYGTIFEQLITVDPSLAIKFGVQFGLFGGAIASLGTEKHHDKWLEDIGKGKIMGCFAMTESDHGSNVRGLQTRATYIQEEDAIYVHTPTETDNKVYIGNALDATLSVVFAQLIVDGKNHGVHAIVVPIKDDNGALLPGIRVEDNGYKLGLNGVDNGKIWYNQVKVPRFNLLDRFGSIDEIGEYSSPIEKPSKRFFTMLGTLIGGRICVGLGGVKAAQFSLSLAIKYAMKRRQFGPDEQKNEELLIDYPSHQMRLIPRLARTLTLDKALTSVMGSYEENIGSDTKKLESQVAALKSAATWFANRTIQECREACGGKGYMIENRIADMKGDIDIFTTFEGDNTVLTQLAAKGVLSEFQDQFSAGGLSDMLSYLNIQWKSTLGKFNPVYSRKTDRVHLRNHKFHLHAVNYRLEEITLSISKRIRALINRKIKPYDAFLKIQNHIIALGEAYADQLEISLFYDYLESRQANGKLAQVPHEIIMKMAALASLTVISQRKDWYLEKGYLSTAKSKAIRKEMIQLNAELRPFLPIILDASDISPRFLEVPMTS